MARGEATTTSDIDIDIVIGPTGAANQEGQSTQVAHSHVAVLAAKAATDGICGLRLGRYSRSQDHDTAAGLLDTVDLPDHTLPTKPRSILVSKDNVHCSPRLTLRHSCDMPAPSLTPPSGHEPGAVRALNARRRRASAREQNKDQTLAHRTALDESDAPLLCSECHSPCSMARQRTVVPRSRRRGRRLKSCHPDQYHRRSQAPALTGEGLLCRQYRSSPRTWCVKASRLIRAPRARWRRLR